MKKYLFIISILIFGASNLLAQDGEKIEYKNYNVEKDGFSLDVPKDFELESFVREGDLSRAYAFRSPELYLFINSLNVKEQLFDVLANYLDRQDKVQMSDILFKDFEGKKYSFFDEEGFYQRVLVVEYNHRYLIFHSVSVSKENPVVDRFFSSLKFPEVKALSALSAMMFSDDNRMIKPEEKMITVPIAATPSDSKSKDNEKNITEKSGETTGLKILSKPRPAYTDLAKLRNIQGTVVVRVTFLSDGNIGTVSAVDKIPFGLTLKAIEAAKLLKFEPLKENGVAYNVVKSVAYTFTIY